jgi:hypothetical protein
MVFTSPAFRIRENKLPMHHLRLRRLGSLALVLALAATSAADDEAKLDFNRDVRPILSNACFACHGPDANERQADLRLDTSEGALASGYVVVPGEPEESELVRRIFSDDEAEQMPPADEEKQLTAAQKEILRRWVEEGAAYEQHWSFQPIARPAVPEKPGAGTAIDAFLMRRLESAKLQPQGEADRETLIRRVAFALTGLPPTVTEVDAFLADEAPGAYERMVDGYLRSPRYGEEMARHWLDLARYADTHGLHLDNEREMWAYRDWVVKAFNDNLPFDDFTVWQVAGDQLPEPTTEQLVATGFNRCNVTTSEGGSIAEEFVYRYAVERTSAVAQVWLGLTAGCAVCHDHKYDPISQNEFYSLYAFFHSAADPAMDGNINTTPPFLRLPTPEQKATAEAAGKVEREARSWLDTAASHARYTDPADTKDPARKAIRETLLDDAFPPGSTSRSSTRNAVVWETDPEFGAASGRRVIRQASAVGYDDTVEFKLRPIVAPHEATLEVWLRLDPIETPDTVRVSIGGAGNATWKNSEAGLTRDGKDEAPIKPGQWTKLTIDAADLGLKPGQAISSLTLSQTGGVAYWDAVTLIGQTDPAVDPRESFSAWRKTVGAAAPPETPGELRGLFRDEAKNPLTDEEVNKLRRFYLAVVARPAGEELASARDAWESARTSKIVAEETPPGTFIFRDLEKPRESFVMLRGQYDQPGEKVEPAIPAVFPQIEKASPDARLTRLDLAKWLVADENPLTARVTVNHFWLRLFGVGLVKTSDDFGAQGESPSHPELLDWLAADFRESGWDVKRLVKQLVMTDAFRRSAAAAPEALASDPENRLYARGPRIRLDAEQIRDNVLFVSGLVNLEMGGRGVNPYQPPNIWEPVGYANSNTRYYLQDHGADLYRRSIYVFLKRTAPQPFMSNFDGPNREQVCSVRERSNTPLQALQLMNDVQHFEAARALAERVLTEAESDDESRIAHLYRIVLSRRPEAKEIELVTAALEKQRELFAADSDSAEKAIRVGESQPKNLVPAPETAAWTMIANLVLNLDETIRRCPGLPHFPPKAKAVIYLHMNGGPAQMDLWDYKPQLAEFFDKDLPDSVRMGQRITTMTSGQARLPVAPSIFKFAQHGQCGTWVSELLPHTAPSAWTTSRWSKRSTPTPSTTTRPARS